jgi:hypothetical protein
MFGVYGLYVFHSKRAINPRLCPKKSAEKQEVRL